MICGRRARWRKPFIYTPADIDALMRPTRSMKSPLRAATYDTLIGLLASSGLRIGKAIKLDRGDVDWAGGVLLIRESKFGKPGWSPCTPAPCRHSAITPDFATNCSHDRRNRASLCR